MIVLISFCLRGEGPRVKGWLLHSVSMVRHVFCANR
jgi:hypothetical protein